MQQKIYAYLVIAVLFGTCLGVPLGTSGSIYDVSETIEGNIWQVLDNDTITMINDSWNVNIGQNDTTEHKLNVSGSFNAESINTKNYTVVDTTKFVRGNDWATVLEFSYWGIPIFPKGANFQQDTTFTNIGVGGTTTTGALTVSSLSRHRGNMELGDYISDNIDVKGTLTLEKNGEPTLTFNDQSFGNADTILKSNTNVKTYDVTVTLPDRTTTLAGLSCKNAFTGYNTFNSDTTFNSMIMVKDQIRNVDEKSCKMTFGLNDLIEFVLNDVAYLTLQGDSDEIIFNDDGNDVDIVINTDNTVGVFTVNSGTDEIFIKELLTQELILPTSAPVTAVAGSCYLNTTTNLFGTYDGTSWYWR